MGLKLNHGAIEVDELGESCALDLAAREGVTLEVVGDALNITRERVRQIELEAIEQLRAAGVLS